MGSQNRAHLGTGPGGWRRSLSWAGLTSLCWICLLLPSRRNLPPLQPAHFLASALCTPSSVDLGSWLSCLLRHCDHAWAVPLLRPFTGLGLDFCPFFKTSLSVCLSLCLCLFLCVSASVYLFLSHSVSAAYLPGCLGKTLSLKIDWLYLYLSEPCVVLGRGATLKGGKSRHGTVVSCLIPFLDSQKQFGLTVSWGCVVNK